MHALDPIWIFLSDYKTNLSRPTTTTTTTTACWAVQIFVLFVAGPIHTHLLWMSDNSTMVDLSFFSVWHYSTKGFTLQYFNDNYSWWCVDDEHDDIINRVYDDDVFWPKKMNLIWVDNIFLLCCCCHPRYGFQFGRIFFIFPFFWFPSLFSWCFPFFCHPSET